VVVLTRRLIAGSIAAVAVALVGAALAWACVPQGSVSLNPTSGAAGTSVTAAVSGFPPGSEVVLRWDRLNGQTLGGGNGPGFTTTVSIPSDAAPGNHIIVAATNDEHAEHSATAAAFTIPGAQTGTPPSQNPPGAPADPFNPFAPALPAPGGKTIKGTNRGDTLVGTPFGDVINCGGGNDRVRGGDGNDLILCGGGNDRVDGGRGNDHILGGLGRDRLSGGPGKDLLKGGRGDDVLRGNSGKDRLLGGSGRDTLFSQSADLLSGGPGKDRVIR
jgi:Ca2+-binding RTX toxin-like protein